MWLALSAWRQCLFFVEEKNQTLRSKMTAAFQLCKQNDMKKKRANQLHPLIIHLFPQEMFSSLNYLCECLKNKMNAYGNSANSFFHFHPTFKHRLYAPELISSCLSITPYIPHFSRENYLSMLGKFFLYEATTNGQIWLVVITLRLSHQLSKNSEANFFKWPPRVDGGNPSFFFPFNTNQVK